MSILNLNQLVSLPKLGHEHHHDRSDAKVVTKAAQVVDEFVLASVNLGQKFQIFESMNKLVSSILPRACIDTNGQDCKGYRLGVVPRANTMLNPGGC
ncbi:MAG: hypothetical protein ACD_62C00266G0004 [uncultured bacterium]|nr:MAG: hypothetical protein ACD_62C00266G0004 [uncultured bacterium]